MQLTFSYHTVMGRRSLPSCLLARSRRAPADKSIHIQEPVDFWVPHSGTNFWAVHEEPLRRPPQSLLTVSWKEITLPLFFPCIMVQSLGSSHLFCSGVTGRVSMLSCHLNSYIFGCWMNRYSTTSVYTELRDGAREDDDGSRLLTIENHLGLAVSVTLEEQSSGADTIPGVKGVSFRKKSTS